MNYEKRYNELIEAIKEMLEANPHDEGLQNWVNDNVPELAESEDERIRKTLLEIFNNVGKKDFRDVPTEKIIAWLEKQGNKNSTDKVEPKFKISDWVAYENLDTMKIMDINDDRYEVEFIDGHRGIPYIDFIDRNSHLWTIQDAKKGDVLVDKYGNIGIFQYNTDLDWSSCCSLGCNGGFQEFSVIHDNDKTHLATKEQRELLFTKMKEAGYELDSEKKELKKAEDEPENYKQQVMSEMTDLVKDYIKQKHDWSEDDRIILDGIIDEIESDKNEAPSYDLPT